MSTQLILTDDGDKEADEDTLTQTQESANYWYGWDTWAEAIKRAASQPSVFERWI